MSFACGNHCGTLYCSQSCAERDWTHGGHALVCIGKKAKSSKPVSKKKAREILHHGTVHGHPLTEQQRSYFAWLAFK